MTIELLVLISTGRIIHATNAYILSPSSTVISLNHGIWKVLVYQEGPRLLNGYTIYIYIYQSLDVDIFSVYTEILRVGPPHGMFLPTRVHILVNHIHMPTDVDRSLLSNAKKEVSKQEIRGNQLTETLKEFERDMGQMATVLSLHMVLWTLAGPSV